MFKKNIRQLEEIFPGIGLAICLFYYALVGQQTVNRFEKYLVNLFDLLIEVDF